MVKWQLAKQNYKGIPSAGVKVCTDVCFIFLSMLKLLTYHKMFAFFYACLLLNATITQMSLLLEFGKVCLCEKELFHNYFMVTPVRTLH